MNCSFVLNSNPRPRQRQSTVTRPFKALSFLKYLRGACVYLSSSIARARGLSRAITLIVLLLTGAACERNAGLPKPDSKEYRDLVTAFYVGLAGLQTGEDVRA